MSKFIKLHEFHGKKANLSAIVLPVSNIIDIMEPSRFMQTSEKLQAEGYPKAGAFVRYQGAWAGLFEGPRSVTVIETIDEIFHQINSLEG